MSINKYAKFFRDSGFFLGSKIKTIITDASFINKEIILSKGREVLSSAKIPASGKVDFFTDESGELTVSTDNGSSVLSGTVSITSYGTYNLTLNGSNSDSKRLMYGSKETVTLDESTSAENVEISYTGDKGTLSVTSSNKNVATATINENVVTIEDAGKGLLGTTNVEVTVSATAAYEAKTFNIIVTKTNGIIDKSWAGLRNIVEREAEEEYCALGEEFTVELSNRTTMTYIIGGINHDEDHQLIFVPKRYDYLMKLPYSNPRNSSWKDSTLRSYVNTTLWEMMPEELRSVVSDRNVIYAEDQYTLVETIDKLWFPKEIEFTGTISSSHQIESQIFRVNQFDCFKNFMVELGTQVSDYTYTISKSPNNHVTVIQTKESSSTGKYYYTSYSDPTALRRYIPCFQIVKGK